MRTPLHLDLLKEEERFSASPIRLRVMLPFAACFIALCITVWWALLGLHVHSQRQLETDLQRVITSLKPSHASVLASREEEQEIRAIVRQLTLYKNSRNLFGETFSNLAEFVPENIQFTEIRVTPPQPPPPDPKKGLSVPTNTIEEVTLRIAGRTGGEHASEAVDTLLATLRSPAFTNLIRSAVIPKGAFRQDIARNPANRETLLFEITCECAPRRFE